MKSTGRNQRDNQWNDGRAAGVTSVQRDSLREIVSAAKQRVLRDYAECAGEHVKVLQLALNEAEGIAWSTGYPQLFFPTLAVEKAQSAVTWHQRQRAVRRAAAEISFAE